MTKMKPWMTVLKQKAARMLPEGFHLYLFGSQAQGSASLSSDYDLGVLGDHPCPPGLLCELEELGESLPTLDKMDWVDLGRVTKSFRDEALQKAIRVV